MLDHTIKNFAHQTSMRIISALNQTDYKTAIHQFYQLGEKLHHYYQCAHVKDCCKESVDRDWQTIEPTLTLEDPIPYCVFEEAWIDDYLRNPIFIDGQATYRRYLSPKAHLQKTVRHRIHLGMRVFSHSLKKQPKPTLIASDRLTQLDQAACLAIENYHTPKQKRLLTAGRVLAIISSVVCGLTIAGSVALALTGWPMAFVAVSTVIVFLSAAVIYWFGMRQAFPRILKNIFGGDQWLEGWLYYRDEETGEKKQLSPTKKILLGFLWGIALVLSALTGLVTYSFITQLDKLTLFSFLAIGTAGGALLPPLGIMIAILFATSSFIYFMQPLINMLQSKNITAMLMKPFKNAAFIFDPHNVINKDRSAARLKCEKILVFTLLGLLTSITIIGIVVFHVQQTIALAYWLNTCLVISTTATIYLTNAISTIIMLIGQVPYILKSLTSIMIYTVPHFKTLSSHTHNPVINKPLLFFPSEAIKEEATKHRIEQLTEQFTQAIDDQTDTQRNTHSPKPTALKPPRVRHYESFFTDQTPDQSRLSPPSQQATSR